MCHNATDRCVCVAMEKIYWTMYLKTWHRKLQASIHASCQYLNSMIINNIFLGNHGLMSDDYLCHQKKQCRSLPAFPTALLSLIGRAIIQHTILYVTQPILAGWNTYSIGSDCPYARYSVVLVIWWTPLAWFQLLESVRLSVTSPKLLAKGVEGLMNHSFFYFECRLKQHQAYLEQKYLLQSASKFLLREANNELWCFLRKCRVHACAPRTACACCTK